MVKRRARRKPGAAERRILALAPDARTLPEAVAQVVGHLMEGVQCPPTDLHAFGKKLSVREISFENFPGSGELHRTDNGYRIVCSSAQERSRQRFTIAHELAHVILESTGRNAPRSGKDVERLCDMLAAECLMPAPVFRRFLPARIGAAVISTLARLFETSPTATAIRCAELRPLPIFAVSGDRVRWGYGGIRKGLLTSLPDQVRDGVRAIIAGTQPPEQVYFYSSESRVRASCQLEWLHAGAANTIFVLLPTDREAPTPARP